MTPALTRGVNIANLINGALPSKPLIVKVNELLCHLRKISKLKVEG